MSIIVLAPLEAEPRELHHDLHALVEEGERVEIVNTVPGLADRIAGASREADILILFPRSAAQLAAAETIPDLVGRFRNIVVLPDAAPETVAAGHRIQPRYLTFAPLQAGHLASVVEKMRRGDRRRGFRGGPVRPP